MRILRGVGSRTLPCGCLIGIYETYDNKSVALVDARGSLCPDAAHRVDATVPFDIIVPPRRPIAGTDRRGEPST